MDKQKTNKSRQQTHNLDQLALALSRALGDHRVIKDQDLLASFSGDESHVPPCLPDLAVRAHNLEQVKIVMTQADKWNIPVVPRGAGTGKVGGAVPVAGGLVLDLSKMNQIIKIDPENLLAVVQPGLITGEFQRTVEEQGLFYPPDPNSLETCTLGGNAAHNAGGPRAFKYGVTREYILGSQVTLMGGSHIKTGKQTVKGVAGYDLTALLVGSEGTLGVFTELTLKLMRNPENIATLLVPFPDEIQGSRAVAKIVAAGLVPRTLEFMDELMVTVLKGAGAGATGIRENTGCLLLVELDGDNEAFLEEQTLKLADLCETENAQEIIMARHGGEREKLWAARRVLSDAIKEKAKHKVSEDIVVPRSLAPKLLDKLKDLSEHHNVLVPSYGHAGDGNYHVNILWDADDFKPEPAVSDLFDLVLSLGGTITGEHGVGVSKKQYLPRELGSTNIALMKHLKSVFDPKGLLNPLKIF